MTASILMKTSLTAMAVAATSAASLALCSPAYALGFTGDYAPSNFTLTNDSADGFVNTFGSPNSISITGGNNQSDFSGLTSYLTTAAANGLVSFNWNYTTQDRDGSSFDPFGYILNGTFSQLTTNGLSGSQSGDTSFSVALGDSFGFGVQTRDNLLGSSSAAISNFSASTAVPTPALLPGLIGLGVGMLRKRKAEAAKQTSEV